jgi:hypothetical protein
MVLDSRITIMFIAIEPFVAGLGLEDTNFPVCLSVFAGRL